MKTQNLLWSLHQMIMIKSVQYLECFCFWNSEVNQINQNWYLNYFILFSSPKYLQIFSFSVFFVPHNRIFFLSPPKNIFFASPNISPRFLLLFKRFFPSTKFFRFSSLSPKKYFPSPNVFRFLVYLAINEPKIIWLLSIIGENMPLVCWDQACETSLSNQNKRKGKKNLVLNQSVRLWQHFIV